jgi:hypothetical protein
MAGRDQETKAVINELKLLYKQKLQPLEEQYL